MNKKFSTLVAGLLLAGGAFSSVYAEKLSAVDGQKFYKLEEGAFIDGTSGSFGSWTEGSSARGWFIDLDDETFGAYMNSTTNDYWIVKRIADTDKYELVNLFGKKLTIAGESQFTLGELGNGSGYAGPDKMSQLQGATSSTWYGYNATRVAGRYELQDQANNYAAAWSAEPTSLQVASVTSDLENGDVVKISCNGQELAGHYTIIEDNGVYSFVKGNNVLTVGEAVHFNVVDPTGTGDFEFGALLQPVESDKYIAYQGGNLVTVDELENATLFGFADPEPTYLTIDQLNWYESGSFSVTIKGYDDDFEPTVDLTDNVFTGSLTAVSAGLGDDKFYLKKANGNYIVAKADLADGYFNSAYQFTEVSWATLKRDIEKTGSAHDYFCTFKFQITADVNVQNVDEINQIEVYDYQGIKVGKIGQLNFRNVAYLAVEPVSNSINLYPVSIKMGGDQVVDWKTFLQKGKFAVVKHVKRGTTNVNKLLGIEPSSDAVFNTAYANFVKSAVNDLETQWALTIKGSEDGVDANDTYVLTNRENPTMFYELCPVGRLYSTSTANLYRIGTSTYQITFVEGEATDGYQTLDPIALKNQQYYVGVYSPVWKGTAWLTENHVKEHKIGLDSDKDNANLWILTPNIAARQDKEDAAYDEYYIPTDSVYIVSEIAYCKTWTNGAKTYETTKDTLKIASYSLQNVTYREYINDLDGDDYYNCNPNGDKLRVALRTNGEYVNLIPVNAHTVGDHIYKSALTTDDDYAKLHQNLNHYAWSSGSNEYVEAAKIYAGDSADKGLLNNTNIYAQTENDLFVLEAKEAPAYLKLNQGDVIRIYREGNESEQLFENGEFASLGNAAQLKDMNPALYVDTAWMNRNEAVNRYDYMLAVNVDRIEKAYECNVPDHKDLYHYVDTTYGRFLVNLVDSTVINEDINDIHYSKYEYLNMPKLGFKYGFHTADKFFVPNAKDTTIYTVGNANRNIAKFAFQMVDDKNFVIETSYDNNVKDPSKNYVGYLKWINGNLVVSGWSGDAEVFSLATDDRTPTANEAVAAEVSVVAVKGAIIVKGAAGKVVTVANILGQTIANQVAASDNVTIAAPAGIAVVTVDGEATKVVVK